MQSKDLIDASDVKAVMYPSTELFNSCSTLDPLLATHE
jgi:hypothetical protein